MLIIKSRDRTMISNWMPIILLKVTYKIYTKAIYLWLYKSMVDIIRTNQSTFIQNKSIIDNILLTHKILI